LKYVVKDAVQSIDNLYRYSLTRIWDDSKGILLYFLLNPSTADAYEDDNTIKSCARLAKENGFGGIRVVNLFAIRATKPENLVGEPKHKLIGEEWEKHITSSMENSHTIALGWGNSVKELKGIRDFKREQEVAEFLDSNGYEYFCFELTQKFCPKHPLYISSGTKLKKIKWDGKAFVMVC